MNQPLQGQAQEQRKKHPFHNLLTQQLTEELVNAPAPPLEIIYPIAGEQATKA